MVPQARFELAEARRLEPFGVPISIATGGDPENEWQRVDVSNVRMSRSKRDAVGHLANPLKNVRSQAIVEISLMAGSLYGVRVWLYFGPPCGAVALWAGSHIGASR